VERAFRLAAALAGATGFRSALHGAKLATNTPQDIEEKVSYFWLDGVLLRESHID